MAARPRGPEIAIFLRGVSHRREGHRRTAFHAFTRLRAELPDRTLRFAVAGLCPIEEELHERYGSDPAAVLGKLDFLPS